MASALGANLRDGCRVCLQSIEAAEAVETGSVLINVHQWHSESSSLGPAEELLVLPSWTMEDLLSALANSGDRGQGAGAQAQPRTEAVAKDGKDGQTMTTTMGRGTAAAAAVPAPIVQAIKPWGYQLRDPSSLHLLNWSERGFGRREAGSFPASTVAATAATAALEPAAAGNTRSTDDIAVDITRGDRAASASPVAPPPVSPWTFVDGDVLVWRHAPVGFCEGLDGVHNLGTAPVTAEKALQIHVR